MILRFGKSMAVSYYPGYVAGLRSRGLLLPFVNVEFYQTILTQAGQNLFSNFSLLKVASCKLGGLKFIM